MNSFTVTRLRNGYPWLVSPLALRPTNNGKSLYKDWQNSGADSLWDSVFGEAAFEAYCI